MSKALAKAKEVGNKRALALCYHARGAVDYLSGEWEASRDELRQALDLSREVGSTFGEVLSAQRLALLETRLGEYDTAHDRLIQAQGLVAQSDSMLAKVHSGTRILGTLAHNRLEAEQIGQAAQYLAEGFAAQQEIGECTSCDVLLYPAAVPIYIALEDLGQAEWAAGKAEEVAAAFRSQTWIATAHYLRGLLAKARGELDDAAGWLQQAAGMFRALPQPYEAALALEALAEVVAAGGRPDTPLTPAALLAEAAEAYRRLGAKPGAERVRTKVRQLAAR